MHDWYADEDGAERVCPVDGGRVVVEPDCPGYKTGTKPDGSPRIMVCYPECGNAMLYTCENLRSRLDDEPSTCAWWYRSEDRGYRGHWKTQKPMSARPAWLTGSGNALQDELDAQDNTPELPDEAPPQCP